MTASLLAKCPHATNKLLTDKDFNRYWYCLVCGTVYAATGPSSYIPDIEARALGR